MKVLVKLIIEVDRKAVEAEYFEKMTATDIRVWLRAEAQSATESALSHINAKVEVRSNNG